MKNYEVVERVNWHTVRSEEYWQELIIGQEIAGKPKGRMFGPRSKQNPV